MNRRFPVLSAFSIVLRVLGFLVLVGGIVSLLKPSIDLAQCLPRCSENILLLLPNLALLLLGTLKILCFTLLLSVGFAACGDDCPYTGTGDCSASADRASTGGLCAGRFGIPDSYEMKKNCEAAPPDFRSCWVGCIEKAETCEDTKVCEDDDHCGMCGQ